MRNVFVDINPKVQYLKSFLSVEPVRSTFSILLFFLKAKMKYVSFYMIFCSSPLTLSFELYLQSIFSRVARVCKSDKGGGPKKYKSSWTTFLKSRLNCSLPGEYPFYFDHLRKYNIGSILVISVTNLIQDDVIKLY